MKGSEWSLIIVALISVVSAFLSSRSARKASESGSNASIINSRTVAETEAYNRARKMDIETIQRQDKEIDDIRDQNDKLRVRLRELELSNDRLEQENRILTRRVARLELQQKETNE